jgi:DNA-binding HxlR family transcriptional regulator
VVDLVLADNVDDWDVPYRQAVLDAMALLRGAWTVAVLAELALGEKQYKDLLTAINSVEERVGWASHDRPLSDRVLSDTLRRTRRDGLLTRRAQPGRFGAVWYQLTPTGRSLLRAARPLAEWAQHHRDEIAAAQRGGGVSS